MAQLKDLLVNSDARVVGNIYASNLNDSEGNVRTKINSMENNYVTITFTLANGTTASYNVLKK